MQMKGWKSGRVDPGKQLRIIQKHQESFKIEFEQLNV